MISSFSCSDPEETTVNSEVTTTLNIILDNSLTNSSSGVYTEVKTGDEVLLDSERRRAHNLDSERSNSTYLHNLMNSRGDPFGEVSSQQCLDWNMREPMVMGLSVLCLTLTIMTGLLALKVVKLSRRPR